MNDELALITPLAEEKNLLVGSLIDLGHRPDTLSLGRLACVRFASLSLTIAEGGHGKGQFAVQTQHLLEQRRFDAVICAGAAGGLHARVSVGDLVAATVTIEHDFMERFSPRPLPRFDGHASLLAKLRGTAERADCRFALHFGPIASGDEDVVCPQRASEVALKTEALCVAWEGSGAARACAFSGVPFLELRGITDHANHTAPQDFAANLALCMRNIAQVLHSGLRATSGS
jgi:adenosylhomocysteine nucleosidase